MTVRRLHPDQPKSFAFSEENLAWARQQITKYPEGRQASAIIPLMWRAQEQHDGWLPEPAIRYIADMLDMPYIRALEVATFYTMFQLQPVGRKAHIQVCGTTPCRLRGAGDLIEICKSRIAHDQHALSADGDFSWEEMECLGACVNAPMVQVQADTFEDLTPETFGKLLDDFAAGRTPKPGPQNGRTSSEPEGGLTSLRDPAPAVDGEGATKPRREDRPTPEATGHKSARTGSEVTGPAADSTKVAEEPMEQSGPAQRTPPSAKAQGGEVGEKPAFIAAPREGTADDLKRISGIGARIESALHGLGVYHYDQIAAWTPENVAWVDNHLKFRGRIGREKWIEQARTLAGQTDGT